MNKKLYFVWQNIDQPYCADFKRMLKENSFTNVAMAYNLATVINKENNIVYNAKKSTTLTDRKKA